MNEAEINRRIEQAREKIRNSEIAQGTRNPGDTLAYSNPDVVEFKPMTRLPYSERVNEVYGKIAGSGERPFSKTPVGGAVTGLTEGGANWLSSAANVPLKLFNSYTEPTDLSQYLNYEPGVAGNINRYGYVGGNIAGQIAPDVLAYLLGTAPLKGVSGLPGTAVRTTIGAGVGALGNEHGAGGRAGGAAMGAVGSLIGESQAGRIGERLGAQMEKEAGKLSPKYNELLDKITHVDYPATNPGIQKLTGTGAKYKLTKKAEEALTEFEKSGNPQHAKKAISELKAEQRALKTTEEASHAQMAGARRERYEQLEDAINAIQTELDNAFLRQGLPGELAKIKDLDKLYKSNVAPYKFEELLKWLNGESKEPGDIVKAIRAMKSGSEKLPSGLTSYETLLNKNPELFLNKAASKVTPERILLASIIGGLNKGVPTGISSHGGD